MIEHGVLSEDVTEIEDRASSERAVAKVRARKVANGYVIERPMGARFAGAGTTLENGAASIAAGSTFARYALANIQCTRAMEVASRKTRQVEPQRTAASHHDGARRWIKPQIHRQMMAQRGAHVRAEL